MSYPRRGSSLLAGALALLVLPGSAAAGTWYYEWSCTGECAPGQLAISGREGPFASREDCEYARDHDQRADYFVSEGNLGGLDFCEEVSAPGIPVAPSSSSGGQPPSKVRISSLEIGVVAGPAWAATGEDGNTSRGAGTLGIDIETRTGRDVGGGSLAIGLHGTSLEAPLMGESAHDFVTLPFTVGLALTPKVAGGRGWSLRADLGASVGGLFQVSCSGCVGAVFDETLSFGYTLKAGADLYLSPTHGYSLDVVFPRWHAGAAGPGNLLLESPAWLLRLSFVARPAEP